MTTIPIPLLALAIALGSAVAFLLEGLTLDWTVVITGVVSGSFGLLLFVFKERWEARKLKTQSDKEHGQIASNERQGLLEEYARQRKEERDYYVEREDKAQLAAEKALVKADISARRSHILGTGYMLLAGKYQELVQLLIDNRVEVPERLLTKNATANTFSQLKQATEDEIAAITIADGSS